MVAVHPASPSTVTQTVIIDAPIETVFEVISRPEHVARWWPDNADYEPVPGAVGTITFGSGGGAVVENVTVVEVVAPSRFAFRWKHPAGAAATAADSLLVVFELTAVGDRTELRMTESGYEQLDDVRSDHSAGGLRDQHATGWAFFLPRLATYAATAAGRP